MPLTDADLDGLAGELLVALLCRPGDPEEYERKRALTLGALRSAHAAGRAAGVRDATALAREFAGRWLDPMAARALRDLAAAVRALAE